MASRRKVFKVWVWRAKDCDAFLTAMRKPRYEWDTWNDPYDEEHWYAYSNKPFQMWLLGLSHLPPKGEAWQIEVTKPGVSRVIRKLNGGE